MRKGKLVLLKLKLAFHRVTETEWHLCSYTGQDTAQFKAAGDLAVISVETSQSHKPEMSWFVNKKPF